MNATIQMSEAELQSAVIELAWAAGLFDGEGWACKGFPDLCMARNGEVIFVEVKDAKRGLSRGRCLTRIQAEEIRDALATGEIGRRLAQRYNVSESLISAIKVGRAWA